MRGVRSGDVLKGDFQMKYVDGFVLPVPEKNI
jgi:hypothetical protein